MPRSPRSPRQTKRLPTRWVRRATAVVASLKTPSSTTHFARETDQPCRRKSAHCLGKNCVVSSQIVAEFCSAEIGVERSNPLSCGFACASEETQPRFGATLDGVKRLQETL